MKPLRTAVFAALAGLFFAGCAAIDTTPEGNPDRMLNGVVAAGATVPEGAEVLVRVLEMPSSEPGKTVGGDVPVGARATLLRTERMLGEQRLVLTRGTMEPIPFAVNYIAEDAVLRRGLNVDVRISVDGKVRWRTVNAHMVTLAGSPFRQEVNVQAVR